MKKIVNLIILVALLLWPIYSRAQGPEFTLTKVGSSFPHGSSIVWDISDKGKIVGFSYTIRNEKTRGFHKRKGRRHDVEGWSEINCVNNNGDFAGSGPGHIASICHKGQVISLGTLGGPHSSVIQMNDSGEAVGWTDLANHSIIWYYGFVYRNGSMSLLPPLEGEQTYPWAIANNGDVVGTRYDGRGLPRATLWQADGTSIDLGTLPGGWLSEATCISDNGQFIGGYAIGADNTAHAVYWLDNQIYDLGTFGSQYAYIFGVNNFGQMVGATEDDDYDGNLIATKPFLIDNGTTTFLPCLGDQAQALCINNNGLIGGWGNLEAGSYHWQGFVWAIK